MQKALFLDRDGVINLDHGYVYRPQDFEFVEGIFALCQRFQHAGYRLVVVTNQSGIARGLYTEEDFALLTEWMKAEFAAKGISIDAVYFCPHHAEKGLGVYKRQCDCRKPAPGMLLDAAKALDIDLSASVMVGDKASDMQAATKAGVGLRYFYAHPGAEGSWQGAIRVMHLDEIAVTSPDLG
ncbi:D-glycero-beta-D-manno-heptose 1,7-bisphosphate 7-phosphatase [Bowmanella sp. Y26]|uniref:D-glycero-beta-D-manno-heptose 1,7-bisphosphate 7-phosphatase n=1 Tax=Bowmanella yangjiangensis TaxID=2811230 RepID=UPI001BDC714C|nr:D-glycero-beta-D-manno-heptose 1,7-bisphosphate 7-phosphatase [Bowmanella yangjiangensis]MBT1063459.1 D-glycero-beta-D-manno-heptose 1,7-bisphosphate 7-phosphatase [Bowmanella yangjiangensis]